ncbi:metal ABC transporter ATP-binding protein [Rhodospira trueperi]|uniref:Zinc transport system ATP-binding protein n=1 Tax=Rhodospira trueperi TaxID=69960 RepID=A0A1G7EFF7_9PROT|nr:ABC transporter ATP-binding protein [Rhodospira trueperi]SDE62400.1 zinc transport system ATP-binding protein [Rhodospira trueperi]
MPPVIAFEDVSFRYDGTWAVEDVSFEVAEGAFVAVLGPNGGGKTTLAKLITGLLRPTTGRVRVFGDDPARSARRIGYVPQAATISPAFPISAGDLVALGLVGDERAGSWIGPWRGRNTRKAVLEALTAVEMDAFIDRPIGALSGGQRQRVLIARALVGAPDVLVLDEPTASIDPVGKSCIVELLDRLAADRTVILISHDLATAVPQATAVTCVNRQVVYNPEPMLTEPMLQLIYGVHRANCPMGTFIHDMAHVLPMSGMRTPHPEPADA